MQLKRNKEMEFETLKKSYKKQIIIGAIAICVIGGTLTFNLTRAKYKVTESIDLAKGTINYKPYDFKIMAMYQSEDGSNYTEINKMPTNGYVINEEKTYCTNDNKTQVKGKIKTLSGNHAILNLSKSDKCYLYFDKYRNESTILGTLKVNYSKPSFSKVATTDEGIYAVYDEIYNGYSYYWRGAVTNNYVKFAGFCWRAIRINGDGSVRLIYDGSTCHANGIGTADSIAEVAQAYNTNSDRSEYVGWSYIEGEQRTLNGTASNAKSQTETWYNNNIGNNLKFSSHVADGKFCNNRNVQSGSSWSSQPSSTLYYEAYRRVLSNTPTLSCPSGDVYILKAGAITIDEIAYAGGKYGMENKLYYLYNGCQYWTMSPSYKSGSGAASAVTVNTKGEIDGTIIFWNGAGLRPVINLKADTTFSSGDGTLNNPYVVE